MEYFIKENGYDENTQVHRNGMTSIRVGKVTDVLYENKPSKLLPFKGKFPIVESLDITTFLNRTMLHHNFEDLDNDVKLLIRRGEQVKWLHNSFVQYLETKGIGENQFTAKNPKIKLDILYDWLFSNKMDIGILEV